MPCMSCVLSLFSCPTLEAEFEVDQVTPRDAPRFQRMVYCEKVHVQNVGSKYLERLCYKEPRGGICRNSEQQALDETPQDVLPPQITFLFACCTLAFRSFHRENIPLEPGWIHAS